MIRLWISITAIQIEIFRFSKDPVLCNSNLRPCFMCTMFCNGILRPDGSNRRAQETCF